MLYFISGLLGSYYLFKKEINSIAFQVKNLSILAYHCYNFSVDKVPIIEPYIINTGFYGIKLIQWIINRTELYYDESPEILNQLNRVYEDCRTHEIEHTKKIFKRDFNYPIEKFIELDSDTPFSSASIGQVYSGIYKPLNKKVAIKVCHPDLYLNNIVFRYLLILINNIDKIFKIFGFPININEYLEVLDKQTNLVHEATNLIKMRKNFEGNKFVVIPEVFMYSKNVIVRNMKKAQH